MTKAAGETISNAFKNPVEAVESLAKSIGEGLVGAMGTIGPAGEAAAAGLGVFVAAGAAFGGVLFELAEHSAHAAEEVEAFSIKTGIAVENVGPLQFAAKAAGGSLDELNSILMKMSMKEAADSGGKFSAALKDIGINAGDFEKMDAEQKILALGEGFRNGAITSTDMADAMALMGRTGANALPMLEKMTPELMAIAQQSAIIWTPETIEAAHQFNVATSIVEQSLANIGTRIGAELLPVMSSLADMLAKDPAFLGAVTTATDLLAHGLGYAVMGAGYLTTGFISLGAGAVNLFSMIEAGGVKIDQFVIGVLQALSHIPGMGAITAAAIESVGAALARNQADLEATGKTYEAFVQTGAAVYDVSQKLGASLISVGTASETAAAGANTVGNAHAAGKEKADAFQKAVQGIVDTLEGHNKKETETVEALQRVAHEGFVLGTGTADRFTAAVQKLVAEGTHVPGMLAAMANAEKEWNAAAGLTEALLTRDNVVLGNMYDRLIAIQSVKNFWDFLPQTTVPVDTLAASVGTFHGGITTMGDTMDHVTIPMFEKMGANVVPEMSKAIKDAGLTGEASMKGFETGLSELSKAFSQLATISGGTWGGIEKDIGKAVAAMDVAMKSGSVLGKIFAGAGGGTIDPKTGISSGGIFDPGGTFGAPKSKGGQMAFAAAQAGAGMLADATDDPATAGGVAMNDMAKGAQMGAMFGPMGMAIGAAAGLVVGLIQGKPEWAKVADEIGHDFGAKISETLAKEIVALAKSDFHGSEQAAAISELSKIIGEAGGLVPANLDLMDARLRDTFSMIETHQMTIAQGTKVLNDNWAAFATAGTDSIGILDEKLVEIIKLNDTFGTQSKAITTYLGTQATAVAADFGGAAKVTADAYAKLATDQAAANALTHSGTVLTAAQATTLEQLTKDIQTQSVGMQGPLQTLWEEEHKFGLKLDDTTQSLLDEAEAAGVVGKDHKSTTDQMIAALGVLHTDLQGIVTALTGAGGVADAFTTLGERARASLDSIPKTVTVTGVYVPPNVDRGGDAGYAASGGMVTAHGIAYFGAGGFVPRGTDTVPAMLTPGEMVLTKGQQANMLGGNQALHAEVVGLREDNKRLYQELRTQRLLLPRMIADAIRIG